MSKVYEFDNSVNQGISERDERVQDSITQSGKSDFKELRRGFYKINS